ncbi:MAG: beta-galactosidase [Chloroflexota bacterium]|nr:beta-galactosidase [Chloroflexota bacterium]
MMPARDLLGCQLWLEPDDSPERIDGLVAAAADSGLGWLRVFLMWPWIEREPDAWDFDIFDTAFDAAARHGIRIKATLTANSGPWHIGTPSMLHSHTGLLRPGQREPMRRYIQECVERYRDHPALGQWVLWNEPTSGHERTDASLDHWRRWLPERYGGDIGRLNRRWLTGYRDFSEIPFPEAIPYEAHRGLVWNSYGPWLDDWQARAAWLTEQLTWVRDRVREIDPVTETCVNPTAVLKNQAESGTDLDGIGDIVDVIGATYHPAWGFTFAARAQFPALMAAGVRLQASLPSVRQVEVTEVQSGNTLNSSHRPSDVGAGEIARFFLAGLAAGATSVTGWCLNVRSHDFEAGDWGLLDDMDHPSERSRMIRHVHDRLTAAFEQTGAWSAAAPRAWVAMDPWSQAIEWIEATGRAVVPGRLTNDGAHGAALLAVSLMRAGVSTTLTPVDNLPDQAPEGGLIALSHLVGWDTASIDRLLSFADSGGTLLLDSTSGRKDLDSTLHRPWPGGMAGRIGLRAAELRTRAEGYAVSLHGLPAGRWLLARLSAELDDEAGWEAWDEPRFARDGEPCVWERTFGRGRIVVARGMLGPSLVHDPASQPAVMRVLEQACLPLLSAIRPMGSQPGTIAVPVAVEHGELVAVFAPDPIDRNGAPIRLRMPPGDYLDLWTGDPLPATVAGEVVLAASDGIALMWRAAP